jgi:putative phage-type endonuclease
MSPTRESWLAERSTAIGASESPILFGHGYAGTSRYKLWAQKLGLIEPDDLDDVESIRWGQRMEPVIIQALREDAGFDVQRADQTEFLRHPKTPFIGCTLDARVFDDSRETPGCCELKNVGTYFAKEWTEEPPLRVLCQVQHQMYVTGYEWGIAAGCVGGNRLKWHPFERHEAFIATLVKVCTEFWQLIETNTPPEVDGSEATAKVLLRLNPADNGLAVKLPDDFREAYEELEALARVVKSAEARQVEIKNRLRAALGPNTFGELPCGRWCSWQTSQTNGYTVQPRVGRTLRLHKSKPSDVLDYIAPSHQLTEAVEFVGELPEATKRKPGKVAKNRARLMKLDPHCRYCGCTLTTRTATLDHRVPLALGGADDDSNYVLACKGCNSAKADKRPEEFSQSK